MKNLLKLTVVLLLLCTGGVKCNAQGYLYTFDGLYDVLAPMVNNDPGNSSFILNSADFNDYIQFFSNDGTTLSWQQAVSGVTTFGTISSGQLITLNWDEALTGSDYYDNTSGSDTTSYLNSIIQPDGTVASGTYDASFGLHGLSLSVATVPEPSTTNLFLWAAVLLTVLLRKTLISSGLRVKPIFHQLLRGWSVLWRYLCWFVGLESRSRVLVLRIVGAGRVTDGASVKDS